MTWNWVSVKQMWMANEVVSIQTWNWKNGHFQKKKGGEKPIKNQNLITHQDVLVHAIRGVAHRDHSCDLRLLRPWRLQDIDYYWYHDLKLLRLLLIVVISWDAHFHPMLSKCHLWWKYNLSIREATDLSRPNCNFDFVNHKVKIAHRPAQVCTV